MNPTPDSTLPEQGFKADSFEPTPECGRERVGFHPDWLVEQTNRSTVGTLFADHHASLLSFIVRRVGNPEDARDIVQQTFLEAQRSIAGFRGDANLKTWLYGIALNVMRNHLSRSRRWVYTPLEEDTDVNLNDAAPPPAELFEGKEQLIRVARVLMAAPSEHREALLLVALEGMSYEAGAERFSVPVGTIRSRISRLRAALRETME